MGLPLMLSVEGVPLLDLLAALGRAGIRVAPHPRPRPGSADRYICRRGWASFELSAFPEPGRDLDIVFSADLSRWRWWNFPLLWLASLPFLPAEVRLQRDAYRVLRAAGARWVLGGEFVIGRAELRAEPGAAADRGPSSDS
ncbi:hypothetical protein J0H58_37750 [bacterium]|nr:hypothetical protein [bacterium]